jgi:AraC-like DNA-binding protein
MRFTAIKSCYLGPEISPEQFITEHFFLYLADGKIEGYDGHKKYEMKDGECCLVRKNHLARYNKQKVDGAFEKVVVIFDEAFLKAFREKNTIAFSGAKSQETFIMLQENVRVQHFLQSLLPCYNEDGVMEESVSKMKREELLAILLDENPGLADILFDFGKPEKINLEAFMYRNFKFNVSLGRFAFLTGRSLSAFKRDFAQIFYDTPSRWLVHKRLEEAYFLIHKKGKKPTDIYLDLGFEDLSHFSFSFKKKFGLNPTELNL